MRVRDVGAVYRSVPDWNRSGEEIDDSRSKHVVAVARNHVSGVGDVHILAVRTHLQKGLRAVFAQYVGQAAAYE